MPLKKITLAATIALFFSSSQTGAYPLHKGEYSFWRDMPEAAQVARDMIGRDDLDTAARQHAAFVLLLDLVNVSADGKGQLPWPAREQALSRAYSSALPHLDAISRANGRHEDMWARSRGLQADRSFTRPLLRRYFSETALREIEPFVSGFEFKAKQLLRQAAVQRSRSRGVGAELQEYAPTIAALSGGLFLLGIIGGFRRVGLSADSPSRLVAGFRRYDVHTVTGVVRNPSKGFETRTHVSGTGYNVTSSHETHVHDQFFIAHPQGEKTIQLVDVNLPVRDGHRFSAVWAIRKRAKRGPYIIFRNHSTNECTYIDRSLRRILNPRIWPLLMFLLAAWTLTLQSLPRGPSFDQSFSQSVQGPVAVILTLLGTLGWLAMRAIVGRWRVRRFKKKDAKRLLDVLDARAKESVGNAEAWASPA
jgi:hypothetical protein